jgi:hypothetical protein
MAAQTQTAQAAAKASKAAAEGEATSQKAAAAEAAAHAAQSQLDVRKLEWSRRQTVKQDLQLEVDLYTKRLKDCDEAAAQASNGRSAICAELELLIAAIAEAEGEAASLRPQLIKKH